MQPEPPRYYAEMLEFGFGEGDGRGGALYWVVRDRKCGGLRVAGYPAMTRSEAKYQAKCMNEEEKERGADAERTQDRSH